MKRQKVFDIIGYSLMGLGFVSSFLLDIFANIGQWFAMPFIVFGLIGVTLTCCYGSAFGFLND